MRTIVKTCVDSVNIIRLDYVDNDNIASRPRAPENQTAMNTATLAHTLIKNGDEPRSAPLYPDALRAPLQALWKVDPLLTGTGLGLLLLLPIFAALLVLDARMIMGAPAWLKPAKFALTTAIYSLTLAWVFTHLPNWPSTRRVVGRVTASVMLVEVAVIALQAFRGTTSHFNVATPFDAALFSIMGVAIISQTISTVAVAIALWRNQFADAAMGWALRAGMTITIMGASVGGLMTAGPTPEQMAEIKATGRITVVGAHTVGGPDGGPGLPGVGWSTRHGDLRVPHFFGLHALQALPLFAFLLSRRPNPRNVVVVQSVACVYALIFVFLLAQARMGVPLLNLGPDVQMVSGGGR